MIKFVKEDFQKAVVLANRFVPLRPTLPVLNNLYLRSDKTNVLLKATNLETTIEIKISAKVDQDLEVTVPAKPLAELLNNLSSSEISLTSEKESLIVISQETKAKLSTISTSEFPKTAFLEKKDNGAVLEVPKIQQAVARIFFAASTDEGKPVLNCIYLENEGKTSALVATDGYRLAKQDLDTTIEKKNLLVPARAFAEALKSAAELGEAKIELKSDEETNQLLFIGDFFQLATRLIGGTYPNYKQIIPTTFTTNLLVKREALISAIKTAAVFALDLGNVVTLNLDRKGVAISAATTQIGESTTFVPAKMNGQDLKISFNSRYLNEGLSVLKSEEVRLDFSGALSPALVTAKNDEGFSYIVMPVKAQK